MGWPVGKNAGTMTAALVMLANVGRASGGVGGPRVKADHPVSTDGGTTRHDAGRLQIDGGELDRLHARAGAPRGSGSETVTVRRANASLMPRLKDGGSRVRFEAAGRAVVSAGPEVDPARSHVLSGNPPDPGVRPQIEWPGDGGATKLPVARDWAIPRLGPDQQPAES